MLIPIDATYVTKRVHTHRRELEYGPSGNLWSILIQLIDGRSGNTDVIRGGGEAPAVRHESGTESQKSGMHGSQSGSEAGSCATRHLGQTRRGG